MEATLKINGQIKNYPKEILNLESLLLYAQRDWIGEDEIVVAVKVDDRIFSEQYEHQASEVDLRKVKEVEIIKQTQAEFAKEFLKQVPDYLTKIEQGFRLAAKLIRDDEKESTGYYLLGKSLEALSAFKVHLDRVERTINIDQPPKRKENLWERFNLVADEIIKAQRQKDRLAIASALEDGMISFLRDWKEMLRQTL